MILKCTGMYNMTMVVGTQSTTFSATFCVSEVRWTDCTVFGNSPAMSPTDYSLFPKLNSDLGGFTLD